PAPGRPHRHGGGRPDPDRADGRVRIQPGDGEAVPPARPHPLRQPHLGPRHLPGCARLRAQTAARETGEAAAKRGRVIETLVTFILMTFLAATALAILRLRNLFAVAMLGGIYSFLSATIFIVLDAVDVAFTESSVGAGITTVLFLTTLALTAPHEKPPVRRPLVPLLVVTVTGAALIHATIDLPAVGAPRAPIHQP